MDIPGTYKLVRKVKHHTRHYLKNIILYNLPILMCTCYINQHYCTKQIFIFHCIYHCDSDSVNWCDLGSRGSFIYLGSSASTTWYAFPYQWCCLFGVMFVIGVHSAASWCYFLVENNALKYFMDLLWGSLIKKKLIFIFFVSFYHLNFYLLKVSVSWTSTQNHPCF